MTVASNSTAVASEALAQRRSLRERIPPRLRRIPRFHKERAALRLLRNALYDARRFLRYSGAATRASDPEIEFARITRDYHRLEKGLALPSPRRGFGFDVTRRLLGLLASYRKRFGDGVVTDVASGVLHQHARFNGVDLDKDQALAEAIAAAKSLDAGGMMEVTRGEIHAAARMDLSAFFAKRHSVRYFAATPVDPALIRQAVAMAQKSPSVCNRQAGRVHAYFDGPRKARALQYQNGNRGFGQVPVVLVMTADLRGFLEPSERYQVWIDGGLFAMSLNYALHSLGLGACMLNWSVDAQTDAAMRAANAIPGHESIIMLMAAGHLPDNIRVAQSHRRPIDTVLSVYE